MEFGKHITLLYIDIYIMTGYGEQNNIVHYGICIYNGIIMKLWLIYKSNYYLYISVEMMIWKQYIWKYN